MSYSVHAPQEVTKKLNSHFHIPSNVVAGGNPCRVVRPITDEDRLKSWDRA
ncbi:MAG: hypothetical protein IJZ78_07110 [Alistipes sp.]|nr:hypothetical protein [Alistipes sp.]